MTLGSLFAGIGGADLGFERAGFQVSWQVEIDDYATRVLEKHWPHVRRHRDVRDFPTEPVDDWRVDCIVGGDPCQENSNARQRTGLEQPSLGGEFIRVVDILRPRIVLRENPSHVRADAPWPWRRFRSELERLGYAVLPFRLRACCFGLDHQRDRLFLLAETSNALQARPQGTQLEEMARENAKRISKACRQAVRYAPRCNRRLSAPRVCRRSDGIPYRMDRLKALGNSICPDVAEFIARRILANDRQTQEAAK